jgi:hypothetical protein
MNIIDHIKKMQDDERVLRDYYRSQSKLMSAIIYHLVREPRVLIDCDKPIPCYRGTGYGIHFVEATVCGTQYNGNKPYEVDYYYLKFSVDFEDEDYSEGKYTQNFEIRVPKDLEVNFTQEKFDQWIGKLLEEKYAIIKHKDREKFDELARKYPEWLNDSKT